ncbi:MAG TPA: phosphoenolpyruvate carboxylase [Actinomycetota bacterium]|nr:phosphoenolpyruvate carboxylase [Actinomycetota bacterium]
MRSEGRALASGRRELAEAMPPALRREVRLLGTLLGRVLVEAGGQDLLEDVERLRRATIAFREDPTQERLRAAEAVVAGFEPERAEAVARAFTIYFQLVNLAEERHRVRVLRERGRGTEEVPESLAAAVASLRRDPSWEARLLPELSVTPVLTAHPTEARRRAVTETLQRIQQLLAGLDDPRLTRSELRHLTRRLLEEITDLWRTEHLRRRRPSPLDEVRAVLAMFDQTIFRLVPLVYRQLDQALDPDGAGARAPCFPPFLRWGSWVGGDRDGNPSVTAEVTRATLAIQAEHVLRGLENAARRIGRSLTVSARTTPPTEELIRSLEEDEARFPQVGAALAERAPDQPYRRKLLLAAERLAATRTGAPGGYEGPEEFVRDLTLLQDALARAGAARLAYGELQHLRWQAETFGFHLASLEVRQHAAVHARALARLLHAAGLPPEAAADPRTLDRLAAEGWPTRPSPPGPEEAEVLETLRAMADLQSRYGVEACRRYVVSFTSSPADLVAVLALARLAVPAGSLRVDVVPLFESRDHLGACAETLEAAFSLPGMRGTLERAGRRLEVMLGYSDTTKEMGYLAANVALHRAQGQLARWARRHGVALTLFHGRGGALGRGGGPANRAIFGQAAGSVGGRFKVTEQGEVIFARYANLDIALRHLEQVTNAVLLASTPDHERAAAAAEERFGGLLQAMAEAAERAYRELVEAPGFPEFFARVTPIDEVERLQIGSRPARRAPGRDLRELRAIPWVFAWNQSRVNLSAWFGLGTGLATVSERPDGLERLREMYAEWPFFRSLVENAELSLLKADPHVARRYLAMGERPDLAARVEEEYRRTEAQVLAITGRDRLLADRPVIRLGVALRNPYVDALSLLQLRFLRELRLGRLPPEEAERAERLVLLTVNGVAAGLQDTG